MPKQGWSSLTIKSSVLEDWSNYYKKNKKTFENHGITSFTGFIQAVMEGIVADPELQVRALRKSIEILYEH